MNPEPPSATVDHPGPASRPPDEVRSSFARLLGRLLAVEWADRQDTGPRDRESGSRPGGRTAAELPNGTRPEG